MSHLMNPSDPQVAAFAWASLAKAADKETDRDELPAGSVGSVDLTITGTVQGKPFCRHIVGVLSVGHDQTRASTVTPDQPRLVARILSKLNTTTREKILNDLPQEFADHGGRLPDVPEPLVRSVQGMLKRLRAQKSSFARGPLRFLFTSKQEPLGPRLFVNDPLSDITEDAA